MGYDAWRSARWRTIGSSCSYLPYKVVLVQRGREVGRWGDLLLKGIRRRRQGRVRVEDEIATSLVGLHGELHVFQRRRTVFSRCLVHHGEWQGEARVEQRATTWWTTDKSATRLTLLTTPLVSDHTRFAPSVGELPFILPPDDDFLRFARQSDLRVWTRTKKTIFTPLLISLLFVSTLPFLTTIFQWLHRFNDCGSRPVASLLANHFPLFRSFLHLAPCLPATI